MSKPKLGLQPLFLDVRHPDKSLPHLSSSLLSGPLYTLPRSLWGELGTGVGQRPAWHTQEPRAPHLWIGFRYRSSFFPGV